MTSFPILDLIAGIIFIYFLLSLINNSLVELIFSLFKTRAYQLKNWVIATFKSELNTQQSVKEEGVDASAGKEAKDNLVLPNLIMNHPLLTGTSKENKSSSYMEGKSFAVALIDIARAGAPLITGNANPLQNLKNAIANNEQLPKKIQTMLLDFIERTQLEKRVDATINEMKHVEEQIENWFNNTMQRMGSKLKRWSMLITLLFGCLITLILNIDSISLAKYLYNNPEANAKLAAAAYQEANDSILYNDYVMLKRNLKDTTRHDLDSMMADIKTTKKNINTALGAISLGIPIGWTDDDCEKWSTDDKFRMSKIGGFLMTILAMLLGAPFWFEVLGKLANLRSSIKPKETPTN